MGILIIVMIIGVVMIGLRAGDGARPAPLPSLHARIGYGASVSSALKRGWYPRAWGRCGGKGTRALNRVCGRALG